MAHIGTSSDNANRNVIETDYGSTFYFNDSWTRKSQWNIRGYTEILRNILSTIYVAANTKFY